MGARRQPRARGEPSWSAAALLKWRECRSSARPPLVPSLWAVAERRGQGRLTTAARVGLARGVEQASPGRTAGCARPWCVLHLDGCVIPTQSSSCNAARTVRADLGARACLSGHIRYAKHAGRLKPAGDVCGGGGGGCSVSSRPSFFERSWRCSHGRLVE